MNDNKRKFTFKVDCGPHQRPIIMEKTSTGWEILFLSSFSDKKDCTSLIHELRTELKNIPYYLEIGFEGIWNDAENGEDYEKTESALRQLFNRIDTYRPPKKK